MLTAGQTQGVMMAMAKRLLTRAEDQIREVRAKKPEVTGVHASITAPTENGSSPPWALSTPL